MNISRFNSTGASGKLKNRKKLAFLLWLMIIFVLIITMYWLYNTTRASTPHVPPAPPPQTAFKAHTTILITGSTSGLGRKLAEQLAGPQTTLILHGRDARRGAEVLSTVKAANGEGYFYAADFSSLAQVVHFAEQIITHHPDLDILVNNAGIYLKPGEGRQLSQEGYELRFAVNYLAPYLLTQKLLPILKANTPARIINVASAGQNALDFDDLMLSQHYDAQRAYGQSKLAMIMWSFDLADQLANDNITVNAVHPANYMDTNMTKTAGINAWSSVEEGVAAVLPLIIDSSYANTSGEYFNGLQRSRAHAQAYDLNARGQLQQLSSSLTRQY